MNEKKNESKPASKSSYHADKTAMTSRVKVTDTFARNCLANSSRRQATS